MLEHISLYSSSHSFVCDARAPARAMLKMFKGTLASMGVRNVMMKANGTIKLHFSPLHLQVGDVAQW